MSEITTPRRSARIAAKETPAAKESKKSVASPKPTTTRKRKAAAITSSTTTKTTKTTRKSTAKRAKKPKAEASKQKTTKEKPQPKSKKNTKEIEESKEPFPFENLPVYVAADLLVWLDDLPSVFNLMQASKATMKAFKSVPSAIALINRVAVPCADHAPKTATDSVDSAWEKARHVFNLFWTDELAKSSEDTRCCKKSSKETSSFRLNHFHDEFCSRMHEHLSSAQRRALLVKGLQSAGCTLRSDSSLCNGWINGTVSDKSLMEVVATMRNTRYLFGYSHIVFSNNHRELNSMTRRIKFKTNQDWLAAASDAQNEISLDHGGYDSDGDGYRYGDVECWSCGGYGHMSYECDEGYGGYRRYRW